MLRNATEPQAMFIGFIPTKDIKAIYHFDYGESVQPLKTYSVEEAKKILGSDDIFDWNLNMSGKDVFDVAIEAYGLPQDKMIQLMKSVHGFAEFVELVKLPRKLRFRLKEYIRGL